MSARFRGPGGVAIAWSVAFVAASDAPTRPQDALGQLKAGNDRFARNASAPVSLSVNRRQDVQAAQHPFAIVLSCADSQVPPEFIFNTGLGDLFVIRTAGQVVDHAVLATAEHGVDQLHIPLLVVMGHESCDIVKGASEAKAPYESPSAEYLVKAIQSARKPSPEDRDATRALMLAHVEQVINDALTKSLRLRKAVDDGRLHVVGGYYEQVSGRVTFSEPVTVTTVPQQSGAAPVAPAPASHAAPSSASKDASASAPKNAPASAQKETARH
jgi:carbonic anhydrase